MGSGECRKSSLEHGVERVVCRVWGVQCTECAKLGVRLVNCLVWSECGV